MAGHGCTGEVVASVATYLKHQNLLLAPGFCWHHFRGGKVPTIFSFDNQTLLACSVSLSEDCINILQVWKICPIIVHSYTEVLEKLQNCWYLVFSHATMLSFLKFNKSGVLATINSWFRPLSLWAITQILVKLQYFNNFKVAMNQTSSKPPPKTEVITYLDIANPNNALFYGKSFKISKLPFMCMNSQPPVFMVQNFPTSTNFVKGFTGPSGQLTSSFGGFRCPPGYAWWVCLDALFGKVLKVEYLLCLSGFFQPFVNGVVFKVML